VFEQVVDQVGLLDDAADEPTGQGFGVQIHPRFFRVTPPLLDG
jgi:hypothetical protein